MKITTKSISACILLVLPFVIGLWTCAYKVSPESTNEPLPNIKTDSRENFDTGSR